MLETRPNFSKPDESYALLIKAHSGLSEEESHVMNARLILILMNQIGDHQTIREALDLARAAVRTSAAEDRTFEMSERAKPR